LKRRYHELALKYHPDKTGDTNNDCYFKEVLQAYEVLRDVTVRFDYDEARRAAGYGKAEVKSPEPEEADTGSYGTFPGSKTASAKSEGPFGSGGMTAGNLFAWYFGGAGFGNPEPATPKKASKTEKTAGKSRGRPREAESGPKKAASKWFHHENAHQEDSG
jgi:DnaJ-class molecular chaperone